MTQSDRDFVAQIFAGSVMGAPTSARRIFSPPAWFSGLAVGVLVFGAAIAWFS